MKGRLIFEETQTFRNTWTWYLIIGITVFAVGGSIVMALMSGKSEGFVGSTIATLVTFAVLAMLGAAKLHVAIDSNTIYYRFPPFVNSEKSIHRDDLEEIYVRKYKALLEYGGYGYRFRFRSGRALNVAGNNGLQLILKNGKKILIGTQRPELMESAVRKFKENPEMNG